MISNTGWMDLLLHVTDSVTRALHPFKSAHVYVVHSIYDCFTILVLHEFTFPGWKTLSCFHFVIA